MYLARSRSLFFLAFIACALVIGAALYLKYGAGVAPYPLCQVQRGLVSAFGLIALVAFIHAPRKVGWRVYSSLLLVCALAGALAAGRQVWLQSGPANGAACVAMSNELIEAMPFFKLITGMFNGEVDCLEVNWTFLGMSLPEWSLLAFAGMIGFALYQLCQRD